MNCLKNEEDNNLYLAGKALIVCTYELQFGPLTVQEEGRDQEWEQGKQSCSSSQQPEVVLEVHQHQEQVYDHGPEWKEDTVHFVSL